MAWGPAVNIMGPTGPVGATGPTGAVGATGPTGATPDMAGTIIVRSDTVEHEQTTSASTTALETALPAVTIPAGLTIRSAYLSFKGWVRNTNGTYVNRLSAGSLSLKKDAGSYTNFVSIASRVYASISADLRPVEFNDGDVTSIVTGSGTYTARFYNLDAAYDSVFITGHWELGIVVTT